MMTSLMSIFDPSSSFLNIQMSWMVVLLVLMLVNSSLWSSKSSFYFLIEVVYDLILGFFKTSSIFFASLFMIILMMNFSGLLPFVFSPTSHLSFNMIMSLIFWAGALLWYFYHKLEQFLSHLTPLGCPMALVPFMVVIELISNLIRPLTLSLRLLANIMAGHMILTLISKGVAYMAVFLGVPLFMVLGFFLLFELGVAVIQSYVFSSLMSLYWEESVSH